MPYSRPGEGVYITNDHSATVEHGTPFSFAGGKFVGVIVKQQARSWEDGLAVQATIDKEEDAFLITKGIVEVDTVAGFAVGDPVYIIDAEQKLTETKGENPKFGRVVEVAGERGTPTGKVRIDLDAKDSF